ncbi:MAG: hypothetical protein JW731_05150 [Bacteroidales bacterium]|nr:hypothetical protein [Bacteroidales bacterium]
MLTVILISILMVGLAIAGIAIKMFVQKGGQFTKTCSTIEFSNGEKVGCVCGDGDPKKCVNYEKHHGVLKES